MARTPRTTRLAGLIDALEARDGAAADPPTRDAYQLLLLEQVAYLAEDDVREGAWRALETEVGTSPDEILRASPRALERITRMGGAIASAKRAQRLREVAERVATRWKGDLSAALALPFADARRELARFPAIGIPGAERLLLLAGAQPVLALDSNALRVLQRLGYGDAGGGYAKEHASAQRAAEKEIAPTVPARTRAFLLLRRHGRETCRRTRPRCVDCPVSGDCPSAGKPPRVT